jgi:two-component system chemotaxis response regulator CheY
MVAGILIVDDSGYMRNRLKSAFGDDVRIVDEAENGANAVQAYKRHEDGVDVVLMDIVMRKANGVKATAAIKQIDPGATVLIVTSVGQEEKMKLAAKAGADGYVTKPFEDAEIREAVDAVVP